VSGGERARESRATQAAGIKQRFSTSRPTPAHEWQTWRRSLHEFAPLAVQISPVRHRLAIGHLAWPCFAAAAWAAAEQPVTIRRGHVVTRGRCIRSGGWFRSRANRTTLYAERVEAAVAVAGTQPVPVFMRCTTCSRQGDGTPALKWGSTNVYTEDAAGASCLRLDNPRSHRRRLAGPEA